MPRRPELIHYGHPGNVMTWKPRRFRHSDWLVVVLHPTHKCRHHAKMRSNDGRVHGQNAELFVSNRSEIKTCSIGIFRYSLSSQSVNNESTEIKEHSIIMSGYSLSSRNVDDESPERKDHSLVMMWYINCVLKVFITTLPKQANIESSFLDANWVF
jgi:hypothetical protein